ncbi:efflux RND transporter periplasmic adaptor subunit [Gillisia sp. M10.2A]|uniref:Efflux RND transporter periplasmic adaptor subunit n=1 Tax=Gillisia lutea TaxID=2909668 RepID=A0ABS9ECD1_9FLAO|nr:efflux RND transporter periplasmic adaptor subunit [Gillisia lutea]MCF4100541.1 efflux RND transporter periplasmic adaptor subunit [Gillisia lutea]
MRTSKFLYISLTAIGMLVFFTACNDSGAQPQAQAAPGAFPTVKVSSRDVTSYKTYPARVEGTISSEIRPKVSGYIQEVAVQEGQRVKKGQLLFRLETQSLSQDASAANANVKAAQVEVDKLKPLVDKNIISSVQLETAKAKLAQAKSAYNSIAANIDYARVKSPVEGVVGSINFREGALVSAQDPRALTTVSDIAEVYANFSMNEKDFIGFSKNAEGASLEEKIANLPEIKLLLADGSEYSEAGKIETISGDINAQTGSVTFRAKFSNSQGLLRNGSSVSILIPEIYKDVLVVPTLSTFERQGKTFVYKVAENDSIYTAAVEIAAKVDNLSVVISGLNNNDEILAKGVGKVKSGMMIQPQLTSIDSITNSFEPVFK